MKSGAQIPYGISDFWRIRNEGLYYIDKTEYIAKMEARDSFVFLVRPRRFGKSLFLNTVECYYDIALKDQFAKLFGGLWIGEHPTPNANRYLVLHLDFSQVSASFNRTLSAAFDAYLGLCLDSFISRYRDLYGTDLRSACEGLSPEDKLKTIVDASKHAGLPLYLVIDEYDNFTNEMIRSADVSDYRNITHGMGFYRAWFNKFKGNFDRIFMTGVSPVTLDDLTSGFNIAANLTLDEEFNAVLGFSEEECVKMYSDFKGAGRFQKGDPAEIVRSIKPWYDGYCFSVSKVGKESVFNSDMALYHLKSMVAKGEPPRNMVDANVRTDYDKLRMLADIQRQVAAGSEQDALPLTEAALTEGGVSFDLVDSFPAEQIAKPTNFKSLFFYYGLLSMMGRSLGAVVYGVPNECVRHQMYGYLRESYFPPMKDWMEWDNLGRRFAYLGEWRPFLQQIAENYKTSGAVRDGLRGEQRLQGYFQAELGHLPQFMVRPEMELSGGYSDFFLFPERVYFGDVAHSYILELKYAPADATDTDLAAQREEGIAQLRRYAADRMVPSLSRGTTLHLLLVQYQFHDMVSCEEIPANAES